MQPVTNRLISRGEAVFRGGLEEGRLYQEDNVLVETGEMSKGTKGLRVVAEGVEAVVMAVAVVAMPVMDGGSGGR